MELKEQKCPYCGGTEFTEVINHFRLYSPYYILRRFTLGVPLHHQLCLSCGAVVYSYVEEDELFRVRPSKKKPRPKGKIRKTAEKIFLVPDPEEDREE